MTSRRRSGPHDAILAAARGLLETEPYDAITIERIAARAGASKQTIYRWWRSKNAVLAEAFLGDGAGLAGPLAGPSVERLSLDELTDSLVQLVEPGNGSTVLRALAAASAEDPDLGLRMHTELSKPLAKSLARILAASAPASDERRAQLFAEMIIGAVLFCALTHPESDGRRYVDDLLTLTGGLR